MNLLNQLIDEELLLQKAKELKVTVTDVDVIPQVDKQMAQIRSRFKSELEFRTELRKAGFGTPDEYRRFLIDAAKRQQLQVKLFEKLREDKKLPAVPVTDAEVDAYFAAHKGEIQKLPATVTLRQVVVAPRASPHADSVAFFKAESIYTEIKKGGDFEQIAKRESQDPANKELGGDFGWRRRGDFVPEFEVVYFGMLPGQVSPPFRTPFGWHIVRMDRVQPSEVKGRHILIRPKIDSADIATRAEDGGQRRRRVAQGRQVRLAREVRPRRDRGEGDPESLPAGAAAGGLPDGDQGAQAGGHPRSLRDAGQAARHARSSSSSRS